MVKYKSEIFALKHEELMIFLNESEDENYEVINIIKSPEHMNRFMVFFRLKEGKFTK